MSTVSRAKLDSAIERGMEAVWRASGADGAIDGSSHGGPAATSIAR